MTSLSYQTTGVVTDAGIAAAITAGMSGPKIDIAGFRIGSLSAAEGSIAAVTDTDVDGFIYAGDASAIAYSQIDTDTVVWVVTLNQNVGNFDVGNIGLVTASGALFCKATLPGQSLKYASSPPTVLGNTKVYNIVMRLDNVGNLLNLSIIQSSDASLPEVPTELILPPAATSVWNAYEVDNHTHLGVPTTALRLNGEWYHSPHHKNPGEAHAEFALVPSLFASDLTGKVVSRVGSLLVPADGLSTPARVPAGLALSTSRVIATGQIPASVFGISAALVPLTVYYADGGSNAGNLTTTPNTYPVAVAVSTTDLYFDTSLGFTGALQALAVSIINAFGGPYLPLAGGQLTGALSCETAATIRPLNVLGSIAFVPYFSNAGIDVCDATGSNGDTANFYIRGLVGGAPANLESITLEASNVYASGPVNLTADPTSAMHAATKEYVDARLLLSGGTMTGFLTLSADPTSARHAATKEYVDSLRTFAAGTLSGAGYMIFPSGFIIQWGSGTMYPGGDPSRSDTVAWFPIAFPGACVSVSGSCTSLASSRYGWLPVFNASSLSTVNFSAGGDIYGGDSGIVTIDQPFTYEWSAFGY